MKQLRFDLTIRKIEGRQYIEIKCSGQLERLVIDEVIRQAPYIAGQVITF